MLCQDAGRVSGFLALFSLAVGTYFMQPDFMEERGGV